MRSFYDDWLLSLKLIFCYYFIVWDEDYNSRFYGWVVVGIGG
jgi:hypothetical protein